jgi:DNA-binding MarR family transcriptional regulator
MAGNPIEGDRAPSTLSFLLSQVGIYASRRFAERIAAIDLQPPLFRVLNLIDVAEGRSQQTIGEAVEVPASRMVAFVDELERRGLVKRHPHPSDRRIRALFLTDAGRELLERGREIAREHEEELTEGLSAAERKRLTALLQRVVAEQAIGNGVHPGIAGPPKGR